MPCATPSTTDWRRRRPLARRGKAGAERLSLEPMCRAGQYFAVEISDKWPRNRLAPAGVAQEASELGPCRGRPKSELQAALFHDGVSTAAQVTDISGRGIGMGAVRAATEALGGRLENPRRSRAAERPFVWSSPPQQWRPSSARFGATARLRPWVGARKGKRKQWETLDEQAKAFAELQVPRHGDVGRVREAPDARGHSLGHGTADTAGQSVMAVIGYAAENMRGALLLLTARGIVVRLRPICEKSRCPRTWSFAMSWGSSPTWCWGA